MRQQGWADGFPHSPAMMQITLSSVFCYRFHVLWDKANLQSFNEPYAYKSDCILLKIIFHAFTLFCIHFH